MLKTTLLVAASAATALAAWALPVAAQDSGNGYTYESSPPAEQPAPKLMKKLEIRPNDPFTTEEGPAEHEQSMPVGNGDSELTVVESPPAGDFTYANDETGWEITPRSLDRR